MTRTIAALLCILMTLWGGAARAQPAEHLAMTLVAETPQPRAGSTVTLALDTRPESGWHGYWGENPGDAGFPPRVDWALPEGARVGAWQWPVPTTLLIAGLMNYVYERPYAPLIALSVPAGLAAGTPLPVRVHLSYLVCTTTICVPEEQTLATTLTVGSGGGADPRFDAWRRAVPRPLGGEAHYAVGAEGLRLAIPYPGDTALADAYFFPKTTGAIDHAAAQSVRRVGDQVVIATKGKASRAIEGVLRIGPDRGLAVRATPGAVPGGGADGGWGAALGAFVLAVLGGLILNVMPCVFPILSLKALSLARSGASASQARSEALAYTTGVVLVVLGLGAAILLLRAGGATVGWAFQLQNPKAVLLLALLSAGIGFNLAGLFEIPTPPVGELAGRGGAFATGALAAVIATPCTGPFMGAALGAALVLPWYAALAVFAGLGIGLALPFLLIGFVPALRSRLPRPGAWMERVRRVLSVPMFLTAIALGWVLGRQAGVDALTFALVMALLLALVLWAVGAGQRRGRAVGVTLAAGLIVVATLSLAALPRSAPAARAAGQGRAEAFSEARLADLRARNRPVFAYFTADWCLTCKVNERVAIDTATAQEAFRRKGVAVLVGDWTDGDPALGRFIEAHNRAGVPLYLYYAPGASVPQVLPQVLTPGMLAAL